MECDVLEKRLVKEEWKHHGSTSEALPNEGIICKVSGREMTGDTVKAVRGERSKRTMIEFLDQKGNMKY